MKKVFSLLLAITLLTGSIFILSGCEKKTSKKQEKEDDTVEISHEQGKGIFKVSVPKNEEGKPNYEFTTEKPEEIPVRKTFYLVTDKSVIGFATSGLSYNTSKKYKDKYGDEKATFEGYLKFIDDKDLFDKSYLPGLEQFKINGRKALRYYNRSGSSSNYKYYGYFYFIGVDDIYPGSKADIVVNYKDEEKPKEAKEFDKETLAIIKSLKIVENKK